MARPAGEREIIARIREKSPHRRGSLLEGIGDDCAVYRTSENHVNLVTTDTLVEGVHFALDWHPPEVLGRKAAAVNISDIAAMGGVPRFALLSLALSRGTESEWLDAFLVGFLAVLGEHDVSLIGGDTVQSGQGLCLSVTILGEIEEGRAVSRSGAAVGDLVMVSGCLGEAAAGLAICQKGWQGREEWRQLVDAHLDPVPKVALGRVLAASGLVHAMMDLSDGLATDLAHICAESRVGAVVRAEEIPLSAALQDAARACGHSALDWALSGGEDYQLLFTLSEADLPGLCRLLAASGRDEALHPVGRIVEGRGVHLEEEGDVREISYTGYEHFS